MINRVKYADIEKRYGPHGLIEQQVKAPLPFPMFLSWKPDVIVNSVYVHPAIADELESALKQILSYYGERYIYDNMLNQWAGSFNVRYSRGSQRWSTHSWGLAVDYIPQLGLYGIPAKTPYKIVEAFKDHGFAWGGDWNYPDGMHFTGVDE